MAIRVAIAVLAVLLVSLQWRLWVADSGVAQSYRLRGELQQAEVELRQLRARNAALDAEITDLKSGGHDAIESRARQTLGMIRSEETFFLVVH